MTTEIYKALEILRQANNLLECAFWAADREPFTVPDPRRCGILTRLGCFG
jgi:hypothetical protein